MSFKRGWSPEDFPTFWVNHASRAIMRNFERKLRPLGFGMAYLPVVIALQDRGPMQQKDLFKQAKIEQPTMAALLARMERDGIIVRQSDPDDGRARLVSLSDDCKAQLDEVWNVMGEVVDIALAEIDEDEQAALVRTLRQIIANLEKVDTADDDPS